MAKSQEVVNSELASDIKLTRQDVSYIRAELGEMNITLKDALTRLNSTHQQTGENRIKIAGLAKELESLDVNLKTLQGRIVQVVIGLIGTIIAAVVGFIVRT